jgi:hypothetical protein
MGEIAAANAATKPLDDALISSTVFGLAQSLHRQDKEEEAKATDHRFRKIWAKPTCRLRAPAYASQGFSQPFACGRAAPH